MLGDFFFPFYIHCWGGADRTGTVILLLCAILGMSQEDLFLDYKFTTMSIWGERSADSDLFISLMNSLDEYAKTEDSINTKCENYLLSCGISCDEIERIRKILLT